MPKTRTEIISDTAKFIPSHIPIIEPTLEELLKTTINDLHTVIKNNPTTLPALQNTTSKKAIITIAQALNNIPKLPTSEGGVKQITPTKQNTHKNGRPKMSHEEFQTLFKSIPQKTKQKAVISSNLLPTKPML